MKEPARIEVDTASGHSSPAAAQCASGNERAQMNNGRRGVAITMIGDTPVARKGEPV